MPDKLLLPADLVPFVEALVTSGRYRNESDVIRDGLELLKDRETVRLARQSALEAKLDIGLADMAAGRGRDAKAFFDDLSQGIGAKAKKRPPNRIATG